MASPHNDIGVGVVDPESFHNCLPNRDLRQPPIQIGCTGEDSEAQPLREPLLLSLDRGDLGEQITA